MSSDARRTSTVAPGPSSSVTYADSPRTTATGAPESLPFTRSAAPATSSAIEVTVISSAWPCASTRPRKSSSGAMPAAPIAESVRPSRHGRPIVSVTTTPTVTPWSRCQAARSARAEASGSTGRSTTVPAGVFDASTPAAAMTKPCAVSTIRVTPRGVWRVATTRTVSAVIASSRSSAATVRPSALLTTLLVTTSTSPS